MTITEMDLKNKMKVITEHVNMFSHTCCLCYTDDCLEALVYMEVYTPSHYTPFLYEILPYHFMVISYCSHSGGYHVADRINIFSEKTLNDTSNFLIFMYGAVGDSLTELGFWDW